MDISLNDRIMFFLIAALMLAIGIVAIRIFAYIIKKLLKKTKLDQALHKFIVNVTKAFLYIALIISILSYLGMDTKSLVTLLAAAGAAVALALKDSLSNVAGGIIILISQPFKSGDYIEVDGASGIVKSIGIMSTTLNTPDNKNVNVPNGKLSTSVMVNHSVLDKRRVDTQFSIDYKDDISAAKNALREVAESCPYILENPEILIGVNSIAGGKVLLDLMVWCATENYSDVKYFIEENVKSAFENAGFGG